MVKIEKEVESCTLDTISVQYSPLDRSAFTAEQFGTYSLTPCLFPCGRGQQYIVRRIHRIMQLYCSTLMIPLVKIQCSKPCTGVLCLFCTVFIITQMRGSAAAECLVALPYRSLAYCE